MELVGGTAPLDETVAYPSLSPLATVMFNANAEMFSGSEIAPPKSIGCSGIFVYAYPSTCRAGRNAVVTLESKSLRS